MSQALTPIPLRGPGRFGLNTEQAAATADPRWALELTNAVFDDAGRIAARNGMSFLTTGTPHEDPTESLHEYIKDKDTTEIISVAENKIWKGTTTLTDISGTITTPATNVYQFVNFNGKVVGVQQGEIPVVYSGTSFSDLAGEGIPNGNCILSAWGRLWIADEDRKGISVSALLDETSYTIFISLENYWPDGMDLVVALAEWQDRLLVFGERSILIYKNPENIAIGQFPAAQLGTFQLEDTIDSGCMSCLSLVHVGTDLIYLSREGLRSVNRAIQYESLPASIVSTNVRDRLVADIASSSDYRLAYSETVGGIFAKIGLSFWYFDRKLPLESGDLRASLWDNIDYRSMVATTDGTVYLGGAAEGIGQYTGFTDQTDPQAASSNYSLRYRGTWLEAEGRAFIPKTARTVLITSAQMYVNFQWSFDFEDAAFTQEGNTGTTSPTAEWALAEWNEEEWQKGAFQARRNKFQLSGQGERLQVGTRIVVQDEVAVAQIDLYTKIGRMAA